MPVFDYGRDGDESQDSDDMSCLSLSDDDVHDIVISDSGSGGQIIARMTIPKPVAEDAGVKPGDSVLTRATDDGQIIIEPVRQ